MPVVAKFLLLGVSWLATAQPWWANEEAPPSTLGLWIGLGLLVVVCATVLGAMRYRRRRRLRTASVLPEDPFAVEAMRVSADLFCQLERRARPGGSLVVDGPVEFTYLGAANPGDVADRRAIVRVQGRLRQPSRQLALSRGQRNGLLGLAAAVLAAAFIGLTLAPATKVKSTPPSVIVARGGVPLGGTHLLSYRKGSLIDLTVRSDVAGEVHFHGYDIHRDVSPGHPVRFLIRATIEGSYPVELEGQSLPLAQVTVQP
jgi:hypothetical protein